MPVGSTGVVNYTNTYSGSAIDITAVGGIGGPYTYASFFSVLNWFAAGEQGAWYDPSDLTTLFQDSAGTTPVTAVEQPVGKMLDKSGRNNHASQATAGNRPILSARVNLLSATATLSTQSVATVVASYTLAFTGSGTVTLSGTATGVLSAGSNTFTTTGGYLNLTVSGSVTLADLRPSNAGARLPAYQRVTTSTNYDTVGFPLYLDCNGTSSAMSTNSIDFTATDKMTIVTGVEKLGSNIGMIFELSGAVGPNLHSFFAVAPRDTNNNYGYAVDGTLAVDTTTTSSFPSPAINILTTQSSISTPSLQIRVNGSINVSNSTTQGTGNFGAYPLYLFARGGNSNFFVGNFYGGIVRGAQSDTASVTQNEQYMAQKTGITF